MKKILLFLTISFIYLLGAVSVNASSDSFYEAEYIDNIYMVRYDRTTQTKYYQKARVYKRTSDGKLAYCLQPFTKFNPNNNTYETVGSYPDINAETLKRISDIVGFGYGYKNHTDLKWYAITQLMIWQAVEPNNDFYFTDTLNGNRINPYDAEIAEINNLIKESQILPSFSNQTFYGIVNKPINITDSNNTFINYRIIPVDNLSVEKTNNSLTVNGKKKGCYEMPYVRYFGSDGPVLFYYNPNSQHLATVGSPNNIESKVTFCFKELNLKIKKIDKDTGTIESSGEAYLKDTIFTLYNEKMEKITDLTLDENMEAKVSSNEFDLNYGKYYLKETKTGTGYLPNDKVYEINFTTNNTDIELIVENKVIEKEVVIKKLYGNGKLMLAEPDITFDIYDKDGNLVKSITTDQNGLAKITLPYGHYKIVQSNTTEGYTMIKPFTIFINDINKDYYYTINDYKIPEKPPEETISIEVPNTSTEENNYHLLSLILPTYLIVKKKFS